MKLPIILLAAMTAVSIQAKPLSVTREQATTLYETLNSISAGLSPADTVIAADDINALFPIADGMKKGVLAEQRKQALISDPEGPAKIQKQIKLVQEIERISDESVSVDLTPFEISPDEIKDAKITPAALALLHRFLAIPKPKP